MNIKTFLACATLLCASDSPRSILIQGGHGIGKSALAKKLARTLKTKSGQPLRLIDKRLAQLTEGDIIGLPKMNEETKVTEWFPPDWIRMACDQPCLLFLDEGNRATGEVMQASFQLVLDRCLGENKLHPDSRIFMAINSDVRLYQVAELDPAYRDRFWQCDLTPSVEEWIEWGRDTSPEGGNISEVVLNFIVGSPTSLDPSDAGDQNEKQPSRRSWDGFNTTAQLAGFLDADWQKLGSEEQTVYTMIAQGFLGRDVGTLFIDHVKTLEARVSADDVVNNWSAVEDRVKNRLTQSEHNALIDRLVTWLQENTLTDDQAKNIGHFVKVIPGELAVAFWQETAKCHEKTVTNLKLMHAYVMEYIVEAVGKSQTTTEE